MLSSLVTLWKSVHLVIPANINNGIQCCWSIKRVSFPVLSNDLFFMNYCAKHLQKVMCNLVPTYRVGGFSIAFTAFDNRRTWFESVLWFCQVITYHLTESLLSCLLDSNVKLWPLCLLGSWGFVYSLFRKIT